MSRFCSMLYQAMLTDLRKLHTKGLRAEQRVEQCFRTAEAYWKKLQEKSVSHHFQTADEEIHFFKRCVPKFIAVIDYYCLVYHSFLFRPLDPEDCLLFWEREEGRLERFMTENWEFCDYYRSGASEQDAFYFLREAYIDQDESERKGDGVGRRGMTKGDGLIACLLALQRYARYAANQAEKMMNNGMS